MLKNAYFLAKIGADTAENEQHFAEILPKIGNYPTGSYYPLDLGNRLDAMRWARDTLITNPLVQVDRARTPPVPAASYRPPDLSALGERLGHLAGRRGAEAAPGENAFSKNAFSKNAISKNAFFENFANFWRARPRLYQNEILQGNMRLTAFFKL